MGVDSCYLEVQRHSIDIYYKVNALLTLESDEEELIVEFLQRQPPGFPLIVSLIKRCYRNLGLFSQFFKVF